MREIEKAIEQLKTQRDFAEFDENPHMKDLYTTAIACMEKQIPIPPVNEVRAGYRALGKNYWCKCDVMFVDWENYKTNYCGNCGQKLREE